MSYYWDYNVEPGQLVRILERVEKMSAFSNEGNKRIIFWLVQKRNDIEYDGKAMFNRTSDSRYIDVTFFYIAKGGIEEDFISKLSDDLLKQYCDLAADSMSRDYYNYYILKDGKVEAF